MIANGEEVSAKEVIDVDGRYVIPGCVDGHTHMMDPGFTDREDFTTGTMAAAVGGITTVVDHHRTTPAMYSLQPLLEKIDYLSPKACVDFGLKGGISPDNVTELKAMWDAGITGFKTFTCNLHGVKAMHSAFLMRSFTEVARMNGTVLIHCEDDGICQYNEEVLRAAGRTLDETLKLIDKDTQLILATGKTKIHTLNDEQKKAWKEALVPVQQFARSSQGEEGAQI